MRRFPFTAGSGFFVQFGLFFRSLWCSFFVLFFVRFWVVFGRHLGSFLGAKIDPRRAKLGSRRLLERYFLKKVNFHECARVCAGACVLELFSETLSLCLSQNGARTIWKRCFFRFIFCIDFWSFSGPILESF